jgi:broad specificity phosphatase PhoE
MDIPSEKDANNLPVEPDKVEVKRNYIFLIRHGESRWNQAQSSCNVCGMLSESDHGLSDTGREQSEQLGKTLANVKKDLQYGSLQAARAWERPWLERALSSSVVVCSPFTRALQTAIIALEDILREQTGALKVSGCAREVKTSVCSMDSIGSLKGKELRENLRSELSLFYKDEVFDSWLAAALQRVDFADVETEWWSETPDSQDEIKARLGSLMDLLTANGNGSSSIVVGHSNIFREMFRHFLGDSIWSDIADSVRTHYLPNCSLIGIAVEDDGSRRSITEVAPLLGVVLPQASVPRSLFPLPPSRCCLPEEKATSGTISGPQVSQPRQCILTSCNGSRLWG